MPPKVNGDSSLDFKFMWSCLMNAETKPKVGKQSFIAIYSHLCLHTLICFCHPSHTSLYLVSPMQCNHTVLPPHTFAISIARIGEDEMSKTLDRSTGRELQRRWN